MTTSRGDATPASRGAPSLPRVAILGRPNVGKSSLFNALIGRRRSITHSRPGVTRDPVEESCTLGGVPVLLVDTGGFIPMGDSLERVVSDRSLATARSSALILLVLDATETTPEDEDFMERLRPLSDRLVVVVNKVDTPDRDALAWNAHVHGFPRVIGVSAAHGRNLPELKEMIASLVTERKQEDLADSGEPPAPAAEAAGEYAFHPKVVGEYAFHPKVVRIAILGKPNTGKSSLANRLIGHDRSIVSPVPGTTRDVVQGSFHYRGRTFEVLDTAGIRRKSRVTDAVEYYSVNRAIESIQRADLVLLLIEASEGLVDQDKKIAGQVLKQGRGIVIVPSKWDLLDRKRGLLAQVTDRVRFQFPVLAFAPIAPVSSLTGYGVPALLDTSFAVWGQLHRRIGTGRLNAALETWLSHHPPPGRGSHKVRFATQVCSNPVRFVFFVNRTSGFPAAYLSYLENCIRRDLGFPLVPISISLRRSAGRAPAAGEDR